MFKSFLRSISACLFCAAFVVVGAVQTVQANTPERPIIFIPGITGSVLSDAEGNVIWGDLGSLRSSNFHQMNLLPTTGTPVALNASDVLREVPLLFGTIEVGLYSGIIDFLAGKKTFRERISGAPYKGGYTEGKDLFIFAYDWRRSNFATALALDAFITKHVPNGEFDLIAHSMGGLVTRIMISQKGPNDLCTTQGPADAKLSGADYQDLCTAIYGPAPSGSYPSTHLNAARPAAERLHTFVEMAVPHHGSVNLASTMLEGWGKVSELLLGGKLAIQNTVLSLAAPVELLPTYENCCAMGKSGAEGNDPINPHDENYWLNLMLGFGLEQCPYDRCNVRRALFRNGIANRKIIDEIMAEGLPASVKANHGIIGAQGKTTRETIYISKGSLGNGQGVTYRFKETGDGTVLSYSAELPRNKQTETVSNHAYIMNAGHPFIVGDKDATEYLYNTLVSPIPDKIEAVTGGRIEFAGGSITKANLEIPGQVIFLGDPLNVLLALEPQDGEPFDSDLVRETAIEVLLLPPDADVDEVGTQVGSLTLNEDFSLLPDGEHVFDGDPVTIAETGVYTMVLRDDVGAELARQNIYVLEK